LRATAAVPGWPCGGALRSAFGQGSWRSRGRFTVAALRLCWLEVGMANGCLLLQPPRPLMEASAELAERLAPSRGSCAGVVEAP
jgi:hypothetical protein